MPLILPAGYIAASVGAGSDDVLSGTRVTDYRFEMLDEHENLLGTLDSVEPGGGISWDAYSAIKSGGTITVSDLKQDVDWLNVRIHPVATLERSGGTEQEEVPLGIYLCTAPVEKYTAAGRSWDVELLDKNSLLDTDIYVANRLLSSGGQPVTYAVPSGTRVINKVVELIAMINETTPAIVLEPGSGEYGKLLAGPMIWDPGTSLLRIINDLLGAGNFYSLWCDGEGQYRTSTWVTPSQRVPVYDLLAPFQPGGLMTPDWTNDRDFYGIPNRYVCIGQGDETTEALVGYAENNDPASPFSYASRGRWVTAVESGVEATSLTDLMDLAHRRLLASDAVSSTIEVTHAYLPNLTINSVVRFVNPDAGIDMLTTVLKTTVPFDATALCQSTLQEVK